MTRLATKTSLLFGVALITLSACGGGGKGPGALGTKSDIVVRNNGLPGAVAPVPPSAEGEITSTIEQAEAVPAPEVMNEPLEMPPEAAPVSSSPAVEEEARRVEGQQAPVASSGAAPMNDGTPASTQEASAPAPEEAAIIPAEPLAANVPPEGTPVASDTQTPATTQQELSSQPATSVPAPDVTATTASAVTAAPQDIAVQKTENAFVPDDAPASAVAALNAKRITEARPVASEEALQATAPVPASTPVQAPVHNVPATAEAPVVAPTTASDAAATQAPAAETATPAVSQVYDAPEQSVSAAVPASSTPVSPSSVYPAEDYPPEVLAQTAQVRAHAETSAMLPPQGTEIIPPSEGQSQIPAQQTPVPEINFNEPAIIKLAQNALQKKGIYKGKDDGIPNTQYLNALSKYQADNKLPQGGLNRETLRHMGVLQ